MKQRSPGLDTSNTITRATDKQLIWVLSRCRFISTRNKLLLYVFIKIVLYDMIFSWCKSIILWRNEQLQLKFKKIGTILGNGILQPYFNLQGTRGDPRDLHLNSPSCHPVRPYGSMVDLMTGTPVIERGRVE